MSSSVAPHFHTFTVISHCTLPEPCKFCPHPHVEFLRFILILSSHHLHRGAVNWFFPSGFPTQILYTSPSCPSNFLRYHHSNIIRWRE